MYIRESRPKSAIVEITLPTHRKFTFDGISGHFRSIRNFFLFFKFVDFDKMAAGGHFGCPQITFDRIFGHFRSIRNFLVLNFFDKMVVGGHFGWDDNVNYHKIHFRWHFWPFQIHTELFYFLKYLDKMADVGHFGCPKFTFDCISDHFRSIRNFNFFLKFLTKWQMFVP